MDRARNPETKRRSSSRATQRDGRLSAACGALSDGRKCWWGKNLWRSLKLSTQPKRSGSSCHNSSEQHADVCLDVTSA